MEGEGEKTCHPSCTPAKERRWESKMTEWKNETLMRNAKSRGIADPDCSVV